MEDTTEFEKIFSTHERVRQTYHGLIAACYELPLNSLARHKVMKTVEAHAQRWAEPILLVTADIEQLYFPSGKPLERRMSWGTLSEQGYWLHPISTALSRVMHTRDVWHSGLMYEEGGIYPTPILVLQIPYNGDAVQIKQRYLGLHQRNIPVLIDPNASQKMLVIGKLSDEITGRDAPEEFVMV